MEYFNFSWFIPGLIILGVGLLLVKSKGHVTTAVGLLIGTIGLYATLVGLPRLSEGDRFAIVLTALFVSTIVIITLQIAVGIKIFSAILAILSFVALSATLATLPETSFIKTLLTTFSKSAQDIARSLF